MYIYDIIYGEGKKSKILAFQVGTVAYMIYLIAQKFACLNIEFQLPHLLENCPHQDSFVP